MNIFMKFRFVCNYFIFFLVLLFFMNFSYSAFVNINSCNISLSGGNYYNLTSNISIGGTSCFVFTGSDAVFECNGYTIDGNDTIATTAFGFGDGSTHNISVQNCVITDFYWAYSSSQNDYMKILNSSFVSNNYGINLFSVNSQRLVIENVNLNNNLGIGLSAQYLVYSIIKNVSANYNGQDGFYFYNSDYNNISDVNSNYNNRYGLYITRSSNRNIINDSDFRFNDNLNFYLPYDFSAANQNLFYNNYFGNYSKISGDWALNTPNNFNKSTLGNYYLYLPENSTQICFDVPTNLTCDYGPLFDPYTPVVLSSSNGLALLPFLNIFSLFIIFFSGFFYFIFS